MLLALAGGGTVYYALVVVAALRFGRRAAGNADSPPVSVLKPLAGLEPDLEQHLRSFFSLDYPDYEILFAVRTDSDPAAPVARRLVAEHPARAELIVTGEPASIDDYPNAKVYSLIRLAERARGDILVISDSDIRAAPGDLRAIVDSFSDQSVGVVTCPYRAVAGSSLWSRLEAVGMSSEFWGGVLVAEMLAPMDFAVGPTMALRRNYLAAVGGFEAVRDYLAEDFVLGRWAQSKGFKAALSARVVEHHIGSQDFLPNIKHRIRWRRSTRRSRPAGYVAEIYTYPLPFAAAYWLAAGELAGALLGVSIALRLAAAYAVARRVLRTRTGPGFWLLLPFQDALSFAVWLAAFWGSTVVWRDRAFHLTRDGRLRPKTSKPAAL